MAKHGKKYVAATKLVDSLKQYSLQEAVSLVKKVSTSKFGGSVEIAVKTFANPKYNDQMIRATTVLPHGTGKTTKIAVYISDDKQDEALKAGADVVGSTDLIKNIEAGQINFDVLVTTAEYIKDLAKVAKVL
jgi:large subunit ribosomal protein L1